MHGMERERWGGRWNVYEAELFTTWRVRLARFNVDHTDQSGWQWGFLMVWGESEASGADVAVHIHGLMDTA